MTRRNCSIQSFSFQSSKLALVTLLSAGLLSACAGSPSDSRAEPRPGSKPGPAPAPVPVPDSEPSPSEIPDEPVVDIACWRSKVDEGIKQCLKDKTPAQQDWLGRLMRSWGHERGMWPIEFFDAHLIKKYALSATEVECMKQNMCSEVLP